MFYSLLFRSSSIFHHTSDRFSALQSVVDRLFAVQYGFSTSVCLIRLSSAKSSCGTSQDQDCARVGARDMRRDSFSAYLEAPQRVKKQGLSRAESAPSKTIYIRCFCAPGRWRLFSLSLSLSLTLSSVFIV